MDFKGLGRRCRCSEQSALLLLPESLEGLVQDGVHTLRQHLHVHVLVLHLVWVHDEDGLSVRPTKSQ